MFAAIVGIKGGTGKSLLAVHAAAWLASRGRSVAVLDADPQHTARRWLARLALPGVLVEAIEPGTDDPRGELLERAARLARGGAGVIVADGPAALTEHTRALLAVADVAVIPSGPSAEDLHLASKVVRMADQEASVRRDPLRVVLALTRIQPRTNVGRDAIAAAAQVGPVAARFLTHRTAFADAPGAGSVVFDMGAGARDAADEMSALLLEIFADG